MVAPSGITESLMAKIAPYNNIACAITNDRAVEMKAFHKNLLRKDRWVDVRKFVWENKTIRKKMAAPSGITESLMAKIAPYNNIACAITNDRAVEMKAFHKNILKKG